MNDYNELIESLRSMEPMVCSTAADAIEALQSRVAELESRLEISPLHNVDGIMARDATIKLQDERIAELEAERAEREKQEPVAQIDDDECFQGPCRHATAFVPMPRGTPLYAAPPVTAPVRLTDTDFNRLYDEAGFDPNEMREAAEHMFNATQSAVLRANGFKVDGEQ